MVILESASLTTVSLILINFFLLILCCSAVWFYSYAIFAGLAFLRLPHTINPDFHPPVTILKPICGLDDDAYENLASFCQQDYPQYQIIFAVLESEDPGIEVVQKIIYYFPGLDIQLVVGDIGRNFNPEIIGANRKVINLANAVTEAKHDILIIADSDIRVGKDYLQKVVQPLQDSNVGVVTCLYRSLAQGWVATLEAVGTATEFHGGVLVSKQLEGIKFALGSTIVLRKKVLEAIGGFAVIADYLADDFQLGYLPTQAGYQVVLSDYVVEHVLATTTVVDSIKRQIRWARGVRVSRPWGYLGLICSHGTATSLLFVIITGGSTLSWLVLAITWTMRLVTAWIVGVNVLQDSQAEKFLWVVPFRDLISFGIWCYGFFGNQVEWRGKQFKLSKDGKLISL